MSISHPIVGRDHAVLLSLTERVVLAADGLRIAMDASQPSDPGLRGHAETYQESPDPTPTAVMGEQVKPTSALTSWTTTPMEARIAAAEGSLAFSTVLQHWMVPVLHDAGGGELGAAVATARIVKTATTESLENMLQLVEASSELLMTVRWGLWLESEVFYTSRADLFVFSLGLPRSRAPKALCRITSLATSLFRLRSTREHRE